MKKRNRPSWGPCVVLVLVAGSAVSAAALADGAVGDPRGELLVRYPVAQVRTEGEWVTYIHGSPMTWAPSPEGAARMFLSRHGEALGAGPLELELEHAVGVDFGRFTSFQFGQKIDGLPVEYGMVTVLVRWEDERRHEVVYAAGTVAQRPAAGFAEAALDGGQAVAAIAPRYQQLDNWTEPELAVYFGSGQREEAQKVWKFVGYNEREDAPAAFTFFVDVATGRIVHARSEIYHDDIRGTLEGMGSPFGPNATLPDIPSNPPTRLPVSDVRVDLAGGGSSFTDAAGEFLIPYAGTGPVGTSASLVDGQWISISNEASGGVLNVSEPGTPGTPVELLLNPSPSEYLTAQVNTMVHTNLAYWYIKGRAPTFTGLDRTIPGNVNLSNTCNAFFSGQNLSINFYRAGGGCVNTAYSSVVAHEYGHFMVNRRGLGQGGFGEGFSDTVSMLLYDDPIIGRNFQTGGGRIRDPYGANQQYPCSSGAVHTCGQILGGAWWGIARNLRDTHGAAAGLELARDLHVAWYLITSGGTGSSFLNSAHPGTAIEVLTVDDDDGNLGNGTPNYDDICAAFLRQGIDCPELELLSFEYPAGRPDLVAPGQGGSFLVTVVPLMGEPKAGSATLTYRVAGGSYTTVPLVELSANEYEAVLPAAGCAEQIEYYITAETVDSRVVTDPPDAPQAAFSALAANDIQTFFHDDFSSDKGWKVGAPDDDALRGIWNRMMPQQTTTGAGIIQPGFTPTGTACYVTDGRAGSGAGAWDVDEGKTTVFSPVFDLDGRDPIVSYWRWYTNHGGASPFNDIFVVDVSNDGGQTWENVETVGPTGPEVQGDWYHVEYRVSDFVAPTSQVQFRFVASDYDPQALVEALIDDFKLDQVICESPCYADCDGDGQLDFFDFLCFQNRFLAGDPYADCDGDGVLDFFDFLCFQNEFLAGCP